MDHDEQKHVSETDISIVFEIWCSLIELRGTVGPWWRDALN